MKNLKGYYYAFTLIMISVLTASCSGNGSPDPVDPSPKESDVVLYDLTTDDLVNPVGIDNSHPYFSWKMSSEVIGQKQTAYELKVFNEENHVIWDSGKVESDQSVEVAYEGEKLKASNKYSWQVSVWDKDGLEVTSEKSTFETGLLDEHAFDDVSFISFAGDVLASDTTYTIDFDFVLRSLNLGLVFGASDEGNLVMWQLSAENTDNIRIRPHVKDNGGWVVLEEKNVTSAIISALNLSSGIEFINKAAHQRVEVTDNKVTVYIGLNENSLTKIAETNISNPIALKKVGFRADGNTAGVGEAFDLDNFIVKNNLGTVIYSNDFSEDSTPSGSGERAYYIEGGILHVDTRPYTGESYGFFNEPKNLPVFRKKFTVRSGLKAAKLYSSALGVYESFVNGKRVGRLLDDGTMEYDELKPGSTQSSKRKQYSSFDITHMVNEGTNAISAVVGNGWWSGLISNYYGKENAYLAKLVLEYSDGTSEIIKTDTSWKSSRASKIQSADIYNGESFDARVDESWKEAEYDDSSWQNAKLNTEFSGTISAYKGSKIQVRDDLEQKAKLVTIYSGATGASEDNYGRINVIRSYSSGQFTLNKGETALVDFGQNFAGWESFVIRGNRGTVINIDHGEMLNDNNGEKSRGNDGPGGSLYDANYRSASALTRYVLKGGDSESYHPSLTYYGFRYIEITASATVTFEKLTGQVVTSVDKTTGHIETSNDLLNQLISNIEWGYYSNYLSVPTDCPQRDERYGWTGDAQVFAEAGSYLGYSKSFLEKYLQDMRDIQAEDGSIPGALPTGQADGWGYGGTGWADAIIIIPYTLYSMYGSVNVIEENWTAMKKYIDVFLANSNKLGGHPYWGDWLSYEDNGDQVREILGVAYYALDAMLMSKMALAIGNNTEALEYKHIYDVQKEYFIEHYVASDGRLIRDEQTLCLYAICLELLPNEDSYQKVSDQLANNIIRNGNLLQTGFLGTKIILDGLTKSGHTNLAYRVLLSTENPSWLYSVLQGATTIWERWNSYTTESGFGNVGMNSFNHYSYGAIIAWMYRSMAGIDREEPGFKKILFAPLPNESVQSVKASYDSVYGLIAADSLISEGNWKYDIKVPANTTGAVKLPISSIDSLLVNGKSVTSLSEADGITYLGMSDGYAVFSVVSGRFSFITSVSTLNVK